MAKVIKKDEEILLQKFRSLPPEKREEFIDLLDFLTSGEKAENWLVFDEWALNLAKERGFNRLTEEDVARIMSDFRSEK